MQESRRKVEATGSKRHHKTLSNTIGSDSTSQNIDEIIQSVFAESPTLFLVNYSHNQIHTICFYFTKVHLVLIHWWGVSAISLLCGITACFITLLSYTQHFYNAELYPILTPCLGIPYLITLLSNSQFQHAAGLYLILTNCLRIPNFITLLR